jgi:REP element-mobilizing transposase RayT
MEKFQNEYRTQTTRLKGWDYSSAGWYYVTICTDERRYFFGEIDKENPCVRLNTLGRIANQFWEDIPKHFPFVTIDSFIIMPNHVHGLLQFDSSETTGKQNTFGPQSKNLASVIRGFKGAVQTFATLNRMPFKWQASYHCNIVKSQKRIDIIRNYIGSNPEKWIKKMETYERLKMRDGMRGAHGRGVRG